MAENKQINREMITETAALLIEETGERKSVTLREIAKRLGCAHTNLYNYYGSLNEIWWDAAAWILRRMMSETREEIVNEGPATGVSEQDLLRIFLKFFDFSVDHPGWYRFLWLEKQEGSPSPEAAKTLANAMGSVYGTLGALTGDTMSPDKVRQLSDIMFCYTYGEITSWLHNRRSHESRDEMRERLTVNLKLMYSLFLKESVNEPNTHGVMEDQK